MEKLKPCPFCGNEEIRIEREGNQYMGFGYRLECAKCGATITGSTYEKEDAIKAWNRRTYEM